MSDNLARWIGGSFVLLVLLAIALPILLLFGYFMCRIQVPARHMAVLIKRTGEDLENGEEIAPDADHKGVQIEVLPEGRHFRNPYSWDWVVVPQIEVPQGKLGVKIRLFGDDLGYGEIIARDKTYKGIVDEVLRPGRYPLNAKVINDPSFRERPDDSYAYLVELHEPITVPAGFKGVVTNLSGPMPSDPNVLVVPDGKRGVQEKSLSPETYYVNPYIQRIDLVDCRSQRFNLSDGGEMGFPSKDGFWIRLDGSIEFSVMPEKAAQVFVTYNDLANDTLGTRTPTQGAPQHSRESYSPEKFLPMSTAPRGRQASQSTNLQRGQAQIKEEIINKIILPNARSFCRLRGSNHPGKDFIGGKTRQQFQDDFKTALKAKCESQGIQIRDLVIKEIKPPVKIAEPIRQRQIAVETATKYKHQIEQQAAEQKLAVDKELVKQKPALIEAEQQVVKVVTDAMRMQEVALIEANQRLKVAEFELKAAEDQAAAIAARGKAAAEVIHFDNEAEAAGWKKAVAAFGGNGDEYARWVMLRKLAPSFRRMMVNTADSPIMEIFKSYNAGASPTTTASD